MGKQSKSGNAFVHAYLIIMNVDNQRPPIYPANIGIS